MKQKILFISRNYPPKLGGLETYSYNLIQEFEKDYNVHKIVLKRSNLNLAWFLPFSFFKALLLSWRHSFTTIHLCDGSLAPLGLLLKWLSGKNVSVTIHGLDITYNNRFYQWLVPYCLVRLDKIVCVSRSTREECGLRGIPEWKCLVIPNGIRPDELYLQQAQSELRAEFKRLLDICLENKKILATVGRLVKRKGVAWFVERVMPKLDVSYLYIIAGYGPEFETIRRKVKEHGLQQQVILLGRISENVRRLLYNVSDVFIMPNITVEHDVEGFGIAAIEAGSCGLPVVASKIQGLKDAVIDKQTGYLVEERNSDEFSEAIRNLDLKKEVVRSLVNANFDWEAICLRYQKFFNCAVQ